MTERSLWFVSERKFIKVHVNPVFVSINIDIERLVVLINVEQQRYVIQWNTNINICLCGPGVDLIQDYHFTSENTSFKLIE